MNLTSTWNKHRTAYGMDMIVSIVFLVSAIGKFLDPTESANTASSLLGLDKFYFSLIYVISFAELLIAVMLIAGRLTTSLRGLISGILIALSISLVASPSIPPGTGCGCFGSLLPRSIGPFLLISNIFIVVLLATAQYMRYTAVTQLASHLLEFGRTALTGAVLVTLLVFGAKVHGFLGNIAFSQARETETLVYPERDGCGNDLSCVATESTPHAVGAIGSRN